MTLNGEYIDFNNGDTLFKTGSYQILATDKAGNSSEVTLRIVDYIESNKTYYISNDGQGNGLSEDSPMSITSCINYILKNAITNNYILRKFLVSYY